MEPYYRIREDRIFIEDVPQCREGGILTFQRPLGKSLAPGLLTALFFDCPGSVTTTDVRIIGLKQSPFPREISSGTWLSVYSADSADFTGRNGSRCPRANYSRVLGLSTTIVTGLPRGQSVVRSRLQTSRLGEKYGKI